MWEKIKKHISYWSENYILFPVVVIITLLAGWSMIVITDYSPTNDIGAVVGWLINAIGIAIVCSLTGASQIALYGYRATKETGKKLSDDIFDAVITTFLLVLWSIIIFGLMK